MMPIIEQDIHTLDLIAERQRAQRWFWYYLCLYVEDQVEAEGQIADSIHAYLQIIDKELAQRQGVRHWKPGTHMSSSVLHYTVK